MWTGGQAGLVRWRFKVLFTHIMQKPLGLQSNDNSDQSKFPTRLILRKSIPLLDIITKFAFRGSCCCCSSESSRIVSLLLLLRV